MSNIDTPTTGRATVYVDSIKASIKAYPDSHLGENYLEKLQFAAFSILSDVQEEIDRGLLRAANDHINAAKMLIEEVRDGMKVIRKTLNGTPNAR